MKPTSILFNKPIYLGFSILKMSKTYMYDFHYNFIKPKYEDKVKYLYGDTDSAVYHIFSHNPYDLIRNNPDKFDTSDYPENNQYGIPLKNEKVIGIMKDKNNGKIMNNNNILESGPNNALEYLSNELTHNVSVFVFDEKFECLRYYVMLDGHSNFSTK